MYLSSSQFERLFATFQTSAFRLQLRGDYAVDAEQAEFEQYLAGGPLPDRSGNPWLETMASQVVQGRTWTTVHLLPHLLTPYLRYLIDWWYVYHDRAGARVWFLPHELAREIHDLAPHDFWLIDDRALVLMHYDPSGRFLGAEEASSAESLARARQARDFALATAEDLRAILARRRAGSLR